MVNEKMQEIVSKICSGNFNSGDICIFFMKLRNRFTKESILEDLADFLAHNDVRDRGTTFNHIHSYVNNFIVVSETGGTIGPLPSFFNKEEVGENLITIVKSLDIEFNEAKFKEQLDKIVLCFFELIEEAEFKFKDPRIIKCYLKRNNNTMLFCLNLNLLGPRIKISPSATIQVNLFS